MSAYFEVYRDNSGLFYFNFKSLSGEILLSSESYKEKRSAFVGITSIKKNSQDPSRFAIKTAVDGKHYFLLKAANHEAIGKSALFTSENERDEVMAKVKLEAPYGETKDTTRQYRKRKVA